MSNKDSVDISTGPAFVVFIVFLVLKLTGTISWSWWWVTAPLWGPAVAVAAIIVLMIAFVLIFGQD
jgi:hypothetical protein